MAGAGSAGNFNLAPGEFFEQCPYEKSHVVTNVRFAGHLDKCRRAYLKTLSIGDGDNYPELQPCRFNDKHRVPAPEIDRHEIHCPDQYRVVKTVRYHESDEFRDSLLEEQKRMDDASWEPPRTRLLQHDNSSYSSQYVPLQSRTEEFKDAPSKMNCDEDWEADSNEYEPGYDPAEKLKREIVLYQPGGLTKSERKEFRTEQRRRAASLQMQKKADAGPSMLRTPVVNQMVNKEAVAATGNENESSDEEFTGEDPYKMYSGKF